MLGKRVFAFLNLYGLHRTRCITAYVAKLNVPFLLFGLREGIAYSNFGFAFYANVCIVCVDSRRNAVRKGISVLCYELDAYGIVVIIIKL